MILAVRPHPNIFFRSYERCIKRWHKLTLSILFSMPLALLSRTSIRPVSVFSSVDNSISLPFQMAPYDPLFKETVLLLGRSSKRFCFPSLSLFCSFHYVRHCSVSLFSWRWILANFSSRLYVFSLNLFALPRLPWCLLLGSIQSFETFSNLLRRTVWRPLKFLESFIWQWFFLNSIQVTSQYFVAFFNVQNFHLQ